MNRKKYFERHYRKLRFEAWLGALLLSLNVGLFVGAASALVTWFLAFNGLLLSIGGALGVTALLTPLFYFVKFRPDVVKNARRLDRLGLEERLVTMVEYENDDSYIAQVQREDAKLNLAKLALNAVKFTLSKASLVLLIVAGSLFTTANTLEVLAVTGVLPGGDTFIEEDEEEEEMIDYVLVSYECEGGGYIYGEESQLIPKGSATTQIVAVADEGWEFLEWEDGYKKPTRSDKNITEDTFFIAIFAQMGDEGDPSQQDPNADPTDKPNDRPQQSDQQQENQDQQEQEKQEQENESEDQQQKPQEQDPSQPSQNGGSQYKEANQVIDGQTYYKNALSGDTEDGVSYYDKLRERLEKEGDNLSEEERYIIESYLGIV